MQLKHSFHLTLQFYELGLQITARWLNERTMQIIKADDSRELLFLTPTSQCKFEGALEHSDDEVKVEGCMMDQETKIQIGQESIVLFNNNGENGLQRQKREDYDDADYDSSDDGGAGAHGDHHNHAAKETKVSSFLVFFFIFIINKLI